MNLREFEGKNVKILLNTGEVYEGCAIDYTDAEDNIEPFQSICIGNIEFDEREIKKIEIVE